MFLRVGIISLTFALTIPAADSLSSAPPPASAPAVQAVYFGQDGHDYCTTDGQLSPNDIQDLHLCLRGLPADEEISSVTFTRLGGGAWSYWTQPQPTRHFRAQLLREPRSETADVFLEPTHDDTAFDLDIDLEYASGRKAHLNAHCGRSDPNRFMPQAILQAHWLGQDGHDLTGPAPAVGPEGFQDARIDLTGLSKRLEIRSLRIDAGDSGRWECGNNRDRLANAELAWDPKDASKASLFFSPVSDLRDRQLTLTIQYANGRHQRVDLNAGSTDPALPMPRPPEFTLDAGLSQSLSVNWVGQDGHDLTRRGDIHLELDGLPKEGVVEAVAVSDPCGGYWVFCLPEAEAAFYGMATGGLRTLDDPPEREKFGLFRLEPYESSRNSAQSRFGALPLTLQRRPDSLAADLYLPPFRDEAGSRMMLRVLLRIGTGAVKTAICSFPGQRCNPYLRGPLPAESSIAAHPDEVLSDLVDRFGHLRLSAGRYKLKAPLVLNHPVTIAGPREAILEFSQPPESPEWPDAIRISAGNTTLDGFTIRFAGPVRWQAGYGKAAVLHAVPGKSDASGRSDPLADLVVTGLDIDSAPVEPLPEPGQAEPCNYFTMGFGAATSGRILGNTFRGGTIDVMNGPWEISDNTYRGAMPGAVAWDAFAAHYVHDLTVARNHLAPVAPCGKTWRFLVLTQRGDHIAVSDNRVENIGMKDDDKLANPNAPEIMLTESYRLNYEGYPARISAAGWILQIPLVIYSQVEPGCILSILSGPHAGHYFRIAQPLAPSAFLLQQPLPEALWGGGYAISIAHGFTDLAWERNTIDARRGGSSLMVLAGNHWNLRLAENRLLGGGEALRICPCATERPGLWGWSRSPMFDLMVDHNLCEDSRQGVAIIVGDETYAKTTGGRTYLAGALEDNTIRWSAAFLRSFRATARASSSKPLAIHLGASSDAGAREVQPLLQANTARTQQRTPSGQSAREVELRLRGNRLEAPPGVSASAVDE